MEVFDYDVFSTNDPCSFGLPPAVAHRPPRLTTHTPSPPQPPNVAARGDGEGDHAGKAVTARGGVGLRRECSVDAGAV